MKRDIASKDDLYKIVKLFYKKLMSDEEMIRFFEDFRDAQKLEEHLQVLVLFWDNILFFSGGYRKNAMKPHLDLQSSKPFSKTHFKCWLSMFKESVDALFEGENSHAIKSRAESIAVVMQIKIQELRK